MATNYYYIVAGLPDIAADDARPALSPDEVREQILEQVTAADRRLLERYLLRHDNANLLRLLSGRDDRWESGGLYTRDELQAAVEADDPAARSALPDYMQTFLADRMAAGDDGAALAEAVGDDKAERLHSLYADSRLSSLYYDEAIRRTPEGPAREWFRFSLNLGNLLTAASCRRLGMDPKRYVIGDGDVAERLRTSTARDWGLTGELDYIDEVTAIAAEPDALKKERALDALRWQWIEDATVFRTFGVERLLAYLIQLDIIARWAAIDPDRGEEKLRAMVETFKNRIKK